MMPYFFAAGHQNYARSGLVYLRARWKICQTIFCLTSTFEENVKRAHFQCAIWSRALEDPPNLDPTVYGWFKNVETKSLQPVMLPPSRLSAPDYILKLVCCSCTSERSCHSSRCGCVAANLACTAFCHCQGSYICNNDKLEQQRKWTRMNVKNNQY